MLSESGSGFSSNKSKNWPVKIFHNCFKVKQKKLGVAQMISFCISKPIFILAYYFEHEPPSTKTSLL